jgi:heme exporter protein C
MSRKIRSRFDTVLAIILIPGMALALYMALIQAPRESTMGDLQRIFYFHVAAAIAGMTAFAINFICSIAYIARRNRRWDSLALSAAELGVVYLMIVLITGPIWAKPAWFVWWTWSPRLTLSLVLCLLYISYLLIRNYIEDPEKRALVSAAFGIIAFADTPLVWFSIRWWRDHHPGPMLETGGLAPSMRPAFYVCVAVFQVLMVFLLRRRYCLETMRGDMELLERQSDASR